MAKKNEKLLQVRLPAGLLRRLRINLRLRKKTMKDHIEDSVRIYLGDNPPATGHKQ